MQQNARENYETAAARVCQEAREPRDWTAELTPLAGSDPAGQASHRGIALDESPSGLCIQVDEPVAVGGLLEVTLRDPDGRVTREELVRVNWCRPREGGRYNAGLAVASKTLCIEYTRRRTSIKVSPDS